MRNLLSKKLYLLSEFLVLFVALPLGLFFIRSYLAHKIIPILLIVCIIICIILLMDRTFDKSKLWKTKDFLKNLKLVIIRFLAGIIILSILVYIIDSDLFLYLPKENLKLWFMIMVLYPLVSAYPQELIYRVFFFHRYKLLFTKKWERIILSGVCFGLAHIFFMNPVALSLSTLGGLLFAYTYSETDSVIITTIEHGIWGDLIFTIGLGVYFYSGAI